MASEPAVQSDHTDIHVAETFGMEPLTRYVMLSIIMPAYNEGRTIARAIEQVLDIPYPCPMELIVVDDGSRDDTAEVLDAIDDPRVVTTTIPPGTTARARPCSPASPRPPAPTSCPSTPTSSTRPDDLLAAARAGHQGPGRHRLRLPAVRQQHRLPVLPLRDGQQDDHAGRQHAVRLLHQRPAHVPQAGARSSCSATCRCASRASASTPRSPPACSRRGTGPSRCPSPTTPGRMPRASISTGGTVWRAWGSSSGSVRRRPGRPGCRRWRRTSSGVPTCISSDSRERQRHTVRPRTFPPVEPMTITEQAPQHAAAPRSRRARAGDREAPADPAPRRHSRPGPVRRATRRRSSPPGTPVPVRSGGWPPVSAATTWSGTPCTCC